MDFCAATLADKDTVTPWSCRQTESLSAAIPPCIRAGSHHIVSMATLSDESDHDDQQYFAGSMGSNASVAVSHFLLLTCAYVFLPMLCLPIPCLRGSGTGPTGHIFRSSALCEKAHSKVQQMDAVLDPVLFDLMSLSSSYVNKAQLSTLKWCYIVSLGRATALWALLCLSETPLADALCATWFCFKLLLLLRIYCCLILLGI